MIHVVRVKFPCPVCGREVRFRCLWFDKPSEDDDYAQSVNDEDAEDIGQKFPKQEGIPEQLVGKWIVCENHCVIKNRRKIHCEILSILPRSPMLLDELVKKILSGEGNPLPPKPPENTVIEKGNKKGADPTNTRKNKPKKEPSHA